MRQIGSLPRSLDPNVLGDYLLSLGVTSRAVESADGWALWVHDEDKVAQARDELQSFLKNPDDARFRTAGDAARLVREEKARLDKQYRKNVRELSGSFDGLNLRRRPLTAALIAICVVVYVAGMADRHVRFWLDDTLGFFSMSRPKPPDLVAAGLDDIRRGEVWRFVTPIFLHGSTLHIVFNVWALSVLGTLVEATRGTRTLAALTLLSAVTSNIGQFLYMINFERELVGWVGISGVVYALFGYVWMKSRFEPEHGMMIHPGSVRLMIFWLMLGFIGFGRMANGAHLAGLLIGILFGLAGF